MFTLAYFTSAPDWLIIGGLIFILFGGQKIPEFAKGLGEGLREFKKAMDPAHRDQSVLEQAVVSPETHGEAVVVEANHEVGQPKP